MSPTNSAFLDTVVHGGTLVTPAGAYRADVGIRDGQIALTGQPGAMPPAAEVIDASGKYVLPGLIDPHLHFKCYSHHLEPLPVAFRSAAYGGFTTVLAMLIPRVDKPMRPLELIDEFRALGEQESVVDFAFHTHLPELDGVLGEVSDAVASGSPSFKIFMAYKSLGRMASDAFLMDAMEAIAAAGGILLLHAEDGETIDRRIARQIARGRTRPEDFQFVHPPEAEYLAVEKALDMARLTGCRLSILHISTPRGADLVAEARAAGQPVWLETCPQYLELTDDDVRARGAFAKVSPPLRSRVENEALWQRLIDGRINFIGSDHSTQTAESKQGGSTNIFACTYGMPVIETMAPIMADGAKQHGRGLSELVRWCAEQPAKAYGLYPTKGTLQVGSDADLVIWDLDERVTIRPEDQHEYKLYTLYEGREVSGWPVMSLLRGKVLLDHGTLRQPRGSGRFVPRTLDPTPSPAAAARQ